MLLVPAEPEPGVERVVQNHAVAQHLDARPAARRLPNPLTWAAHEASNAVVLVRTGVIAPMNPVKLPRLGLAALKFGISLATGASANAVRHPDAAMLIDEQGKLTWRDIDHRTDALAAALRARGVRAGDGVGLMARNGRGFVEPAIAIAKRR